MTALSFGSMIQTPHTTISPTDALIQATQWRQVYLKNRPVDHQGQPRNGPAKQFAIRQLENATYVANGEHAL